MLREVALRHCFTTQVTALCMPAGVGMEYDHMAPQPAIPQSQYLTEQINKSTDQLDNHRFTGRQLVAT